MALFPFWSHFVGGGNRKPGGGGPRGVAISELPVEKWALCMAVQTLGWTATSFEAWLMRAIEARGRCDAIESNCRLEDRGSELMSSLTARGKRAWRLMADICQG